MLCLELEAAGYKASTKYSGYADMIIAEPEHSVGDNCITFSEHSGAMLLRPFDIEELIALIEQRTAGVNKSPENDGLYVSSTAKYAMYRGVQVTLSELEHKLLYYLYCHIDGYISVGELATELFGEAGAENPVRVYISYLRNKLDEAFGVKFIYTARGKGYMLRSK